MAARVWPLATRCAFPDVEAADDAGGLGVDGLPLERLDLTVSGQGADEGLPLDAGERDFGRSAFAEHTPSDCRRGREQQQEQPFLQMRFLSSIVA